MRSSAQAQAIRVANPHGYGDWFKEKHAFELECWRRLLRVPCAARRSNQSILKEINTECSLRTEAVVEATILWPPDAKSRFTKKDPDAREDWRQEKGATEMSWLDGITGSMDINLSQLWKVVKAREAWHAAVHAAAELDMTEQLNNNPKTFSGVIRREACSFLKRNRFSA